jgi:hypothetical protein
MEHILCVISLRNYQGYYAAETEVFAMETSEILSNI